MTHPLAGGARGGDTGWLVVLGWDQGGGSAWGGVGLSSGAEQGCGGRWDTARTAMLCVTRTWCWGWRQPPQEREDRAGASLPCAKHFGEAGAEGWDLAVTPSASALGLICVPRAQGQPGFSSGPGEPATKTSFSSILFLTRKVVI